MNKKNKKNQQDFSWKRFWKNFNLAVGPIIRLGLITAAIIFSINHTSTDVQKEGVSSFITPVCTIGAALFGVVRKRKPPA